MELRGNASKTATADPATMAAILRFFVRLAARILRRSVTSMPRETGSSRIGAILIGFGRSSPLTRVNVGRGQTRSSTSWSPINGSGAIAISCSSSFFAVLFAVYRTPVRLVEHEQMFVSSIYPNRCLLSLYSLSTVVANGCSQRIARQSKEWLWQRF